MRTRFLEVQIDVRQPGSPKLMVAVRRGDGSIHYLSMGNLVGRKPSEVIEEAVKEAQILEDAEMVLLGLSGDEKSQVDAGR